MIKLFPKNCDEDKPKSIHSPLKNQQALMRENPRSRVFKKDFELVIDAEEDFKDESKNMYKTEDDPLSPNKHFRSVADTQVKTIFNKEETANYLTSGMVKRMSAFGHSNKRFSTIDRKSGKKKRHRTQNRDNESQSNLSRKSSLLDEWEAQYGGKEKRKFHIDRQNELANWDITKVPK